MAAKTVVCPECGTPAAPGRYACAECGALLASVATAPRSLSAAETNDEGTQVVESAAHVEPAVAVADPPATVEEPAALETHETVEARETVGVGPAVVTPTYLKAGRPRPKAPQPDLLSDADAAVPFDEDAPISSRAESQAALAPEIPDNLPDAADAPDAPDAPAADSGPAEVGPAEVGPAEVLGNGAPSGDDAWSEEAAQPTALADPGVVPGWPPAGDQGVVNRPEPQTPAGTYLPPSAILPPLGAVPSGAGIAAAAAVQTDRGPAAWAERGSAALAGAFDNIRVPADAARRTITIGAGTAAIGILLPWVNGLPGESPFAGYLNRWGLAGPGMWLVLLGLVALAIWAGSSGRAASWPIGLPAVAMAAFLVGLLWPSVAGGSGRSLGIWVVLVGAMVLVVGGVLDRLVRHAPSESGVPTPDAGGR